MDKKNIELKLNQIKFKLEMGKLKAKRNVKAVQKWAAENPEKAWIAGTTLAAGVGYGVKNLVSHAKVRKAEKLRDSSIYDRSLGMYWETKKPLTSKQRLVIEERKRSGESMGQILKTMGLLK